MSADKILEHLDLAERGSGTWSMRVHRSLCLGPVDAKHMSGGACAAVLIDALQTVSSKPLIQGNVQFWRAPAAAERVDINIWHHRPGRSIDVAMAQMSVGNEPCAHIMASCGRRSDDISFQWTHPIDAPRPDACEPLAFIRADENDLHTFLDVRQAGMPQNGRLNFWVRTPAADTARDARFLALIADYLPEAIHGNIGRPAGATSLDNSIRIMGATYADWVYCEVQLDAIRNGVFHGFIEIFAQDGTLLAKGAQSGVVRAISS